MDGTFTANISQGFGTKFEDLAKIISLVAVNVKRLPFFHEKSVRSHCRLHKAQCHGSSTLGHMERK
jgi:hypothetical protein